MHLADESHEKGFVADNLRDDVDDVGGGSLTYRKTRQTRSNVLLSWNMCHMVPLSTSGLKQHIITYGLSAFSKSFIFHAKHGISMFQTLNEYAFMCAFGLIGGQSAECFEISLKSVLCLNFPLISKLKFSNLCVLGLYCSLTV